MSSLPAGRGISVVLVRAGFVGAGKYRAGKIISQKVHSNSWLLSAIPVESVQFSRLECVQPIPLIFRVKRLFTEHFYRHL
jgi:hypothetical protein